MLIPQVPSNFRGDALARSRRGSTTQEDDFGFLTEPMDAVGLFDVFHQGWFALLLAVTVASTGAYVVSRFPGVWAAITRPRKRVPDRYFELAPHRVQREGAIESDRLAACCGSKRYRVEQMVEGDSDLHLRRPLPVGAAGYAADSRRGHRVHPRRGGVAGSMRSPRRCSWRRTARCRCSR